MRVLEHPAALASAAHPQPAATVPRVRRRSCFGGVLKRTQDILIAAPALVLLSPVMLAIAVAVKVQDGAPVFFVQPRMGRDGAQFPFIKFRSMVTDAEARLAQQLRDDPAAAKEWNEKQKLTNDPRVTPIGRFLRSTSLDELPQFANVLLGHMSVVGPRPMLQDQVAAYGPAFVAYCTARPGITGLWQVSGRNETSFVERSKLDEVYLRAWRFSTDLTLLFRTVGVVLQRRGAC